MNYPAMTDWSLLVEYSSSHTTQRLENLSTPPLMPIPDGVKLSYWSVSHMQFGPLTRSRRLCNLFRFLSPTPCWSKIPKSPGTVSLSGWSPSWMPSEAFRSLIAEAQTEVWEPLKKYQRDYFSEKYEQARGLLTYRCVFVQPQRSKDFIVTPAKIKTTSNK